MRGLNINFTGRGQSYKHRPQHTDIATTRLTRPRGPSQRKYIPRFELRLEPFSFVLRIQQIIRHRNFIIHQYKKKCIYLFFSFLLQLLSLLEKKKHDCLVHRFMLNASLRQEKGIFEEFLQNLVNFLLFI